LRSLGNSVHRNFPDEKRYSGFGLPPIVVEQIYCIACDQLKKTKNKGLCLAASGLSSV